MGAKQNKKSQNKTQSKKALVDHDQELVKAKTNNNNTNSIGSDLATIWRESIQNNNKSIYLWGVLPLVLLVLWTSTTASSSPQLVEDVNKSPLGRVLDHVVHVSREIVRYDHEIPFDVVDRTLYANQNISKGSLILDIPRPTHLWQTDALLDPFIRENLFSARHEVSGQLVDHKAYLAAYLAMYANSTSSYSTYLNYLPTEKDYELHPIFQPLDRLAQTFGTHSMAYILIRNQRMEWESEYQAFVRKSPAFGKQVSNLHDYLVARIHVVSRAYSTLTTPQESDVVGGTKSDLDLYLRALNYNYAKDGFTVMVPILDALNHHHKNYNVEYKYNPDSHSFSILAAQDIPVNTELTINYGSKVDQWLYTNYGFVNTDGSGRAGASLAAFHTLHAAKASIPREAAAYKEYQEAQRKELLAYFHYDDGIDHCVGSQDDTTPLQRILDDDLLEFKRMKFNLLKTIVNDPLRWMVSLPPRNVSAAGSFGVPTFSMDVMETLDKDSGLMGIFSTCRLLALAKEDYTGRAKEVLEGLLKKYSTAEPKFRMIPGSPQLEYRARVWLKRLVLSTLQKYKDCPTTSSSSAEEAERLLTLQSGNNHNVPALQIMESHIRLEELQTLEFLLEYTNQYLEREKNAAKHIHEKPCPAELSANL